MKIHLRPLALFLAGGVVSCGPGGGLPDDLARSQRALGPASPGLDRAGVLSVTEAQAFTNNQGVAWAGAYVGGACNGGSGWTKNALISINNAVGWQFMPIYVGQQAPSICGSSNLTATQGTTDGNDAVSIMAAYNWAPNAGIPICLDVEAGTASSGTAYTHAWLDAVHAGGYLGYVYSNPSGINSFANSGLPMDGVWIAAWPYSTFQAGLSPYSETTVTGFQNHNRAWQYASDNGAGVDWDTADIVLAPAPGQVNPDAGPPPPRPILSQLAANDTVTLLNDKDGGAEAFFTSPGHQLMHISTNGTAETWTAAQSLDTGATCGSAAIYWPSPWLYPEVFSPKTDNTTGHLWRTGGAWNTYQTFGGFSLSHLQTVTWPDGHTEVFALGADQHLWHQYWDLGTSAWSNWSSLGGTIQSAPGSIIWGDGHAEVFATGANGAVNHTYSSSSASGWSAWSAIGGSFASRPVPVRLGDGNVNIYGVGTDGYLYESKFTTAWSAFTALDTATKLFGEPSVIVNPDGTVEVFARDTTGHVVHTWSGTSWAPVQTLGTPQAAGSDPFGWVRDDGTVDVFVVDLTGQLMRISRTGGTWGSWDVLATGVAPCAPTVPVTDAGTQDSGLPGTDAGSSDAGLGGGDGGRPGADGGGSTDGGTSGSGAGGGCHCGAASGAGLVAPMLMLALATLAMRRKRT